VRSSEWRLEIREEEEMEMEYCEEREGQASKCFPVRARRLTGCLLK